MQITWSKFLFLIENCGCDAGDTASTIQMRTTLYGIGEQQETKGPEDPTQKNHLSTLDHIHFSQFHVR